MTDPLDRRPGDPRAPALRDRYHAGFGPAPLPVPVDAIAADLLGLLVEEVEGLPYSGALLPSARRVMLNAGEARESPQRRRFTLAHEIGHWVCQCEEGRAPAPEILCRSADMAADAPRDLEREANVFAAELLMPEAEVRAAAADHGSAEVLAAIFAVSEPAMAWRLYNLGLGRAPDNPAM
jgi:hypothetical protein